MAARHEEKCYKITFSYIFLFTKDYDIEKWRRGGKGHRIPGDTADSWFENQRIRWQKIGGATEEWLNLV